VSYHVPQRSNWICRECGKTWPCEEGQAELVAEYAGSPVALAMYLAASLVEATVDLPHALAGELSHRFIGWYRPAVRSGALAPHEPRQNRVPQNLPPL
jgi:hypothetical protein